MPGEFVNVTITRAEVHDLEGALAAKELEEPRQPEAQLTLADAWWDLAQKTDAKMMTRALLLSDEAWAGKLAHLLGGQARHAKSTAIAPAVAATSPGRSRADNRKSPQKTYSGKKQ